MQVTHWGLDAAGLLALTTARPGEGGLRKLENSPRAGLQGPPSALIRSG